MKKSVDEYFQKARSWSDDVYVEAIASRNRYRFAFMWSSIIISLLLVGFILLLPLQHTQLVLVHHMNDGTVWVEQPKTITLDRAQIESDIVRYVVNRESYNASNYKHQYALINLLSSENVAKEYQHIQSVYNSNSPINHFKNQVIRSVHIQNIIYLNKNLKHHLIQVNFMVVDRDLRTGHQKKKALLALLSWKYRGTPKDPSSRWLNWDGFMVTNYSIQQRNI